MIDVLVLEALPPLAGQVGILLAIWAFPTEIVELALDMAGSSPPWLPPILGGVAPLFGGNPPGGPGPGPNPPPAPGPPGPPTDPPSDDDPPPEDEPEKEEDECKK